MNRRSFLAQGFSTAATLGAAALAAEISGSAPVSSRGAPSQPAELNRPPPLAGETVFEFVRAGHGDLAKVKKMLGQEPALLNAMWDWGAGDWETALGGAAHVGNRELALHLLNAGARFDAFCAAMLGEKDVVKALLRFNPAVALARGPHGYSLLYHCAYPGDVELAATVAARLTADRSKDANQTLQPAVARGHIELVRWLLANGVDNPNTKNFAGKTPLDLALASGNEEMARIIRAAGGVGG